MYVKENVKGGRKPKLYAQLAASRLRYDILSQYL